MSKKKILILATIVIALIAVVSTTAHAAEGKWIKTEPGVEIYVPDNNEPEQQKTELWGSCTLTWYCGCEKCNGKGCGGIDCKGRPLVEGLTAANNLLPLGTKIYIEGYGTFEIRDRGGKAMNGKHIDIYTSMSHRDALRKLPQGTKAKVYIIRENE